MTNNQLTENDLISRLLGRAKHLRDVGAIKSPELLEEAAAELQELRKSSPATAAASDVLAERQRQMTAEGGGTGRR